MPTFDQSAGVSEGGPLDKRQISVQGPRATNNGYSLYDSEGLTADNTQQGIDPVFAFIATLENLSDWR